MSLNDGTAMYLAHLRNITSQLVGATYKFQQAILTNNKDSQKSISREISQIISVLKKTLTERYQVEWIDGIHKCVTWLVADGAANPEPGVLQLKELFKFQEAAKSHDWGTAFATETAVIDFDAIYRDAASELGIPALFQELVKQLEIILDAKVIDSISARQEIERLLEIVKRNANRDLFSVIQVKQVLITFATNFGLEILESVPVISPAVKAFRKTLEQLAGTMPTLQHAVEDRINAQLIPPHTIQLNQVIQPPRIGSDVPENDAEIPQIKSE